MGPRPRMACCLLGLAAHGLPGTLALQRLAGPRPARVDVNESACDSASNGRPVIEHLLPWLEAESEPFALGTQGAVFLARVRTPLDHWQLGENAQWAGHLHGGDVVVVKKASIRVPQCHPPPAFKGWRNCMNQAQVEEATYRVLDAEGEHDGIPAVYGFGSGCVLDDQCYHHLTVMEHFHQAHSFEDCWADRSPEAPCRAVASDAASSERLWLELLQGYQHMCRVGIIQRDGWRENRVASWDDIHQRWTTKIVDFGAAWNLEEHPDNAHQNCGTDLRILLNTAKALDNAMLSPFRLSARLRKCRKVLHDVERSLSDESPTMGEGFLVMLGLRRARFDFSHRDQALRAYQELVATLL